MLSYRDYEKEVFDWLMSKHQKDSEFTFSVRKVANKSARRDYFIGTEKSRYFQTTFWDVKVAFPGSSGDLINVVFEFASDGYKFKFEFNQTNDPHNEQNQAALELIQLAKKDIGEINPERFYVAPEGNKMEYYKLKGQRSSYPNLNELFSDLEKYLPKVIEIVDKYIDDVKGKYPDFIAGRITPDAFDTNLEKMYTRFEKYAEIEGDDTVRETAGAEENDRKEDEDFEVHLNQILYGPPGTGKTYSTKNIAIAIIKNDQSYLLDHEHDREEIVRLYDSYKESNQIRFVTFHPSFTYEDFVEGIKPKLIEEGGEQKGEVSYEMKDGIFKEICDSAKAAQTIESYSIPEEVTETREVHKISLGDSTNPEDDKIYKYCIENGLVSIGFLGDIDFTGAKDHKEIENRAVQNGYKKTDFGIDAIHRFKHWLKDGDVVFVSRGNKKLRAIGIVRDKNGEGYFYDTERSEYNHFRHVEWVLIDQEIPVKDIYYANFSQQTIYSMYTGRINWDYFKGVGINEEVDEKRFVLIIDEINRGNIPSIFGELITMIEHDKREGGKETVSVELPYSKESFCVPSNVYIIGTMNTADRSVEALDIALRRRFEFKSFYCDSGKIVQPENFEVDLVQLLTTINNRIEYLLDRDHTIGHSYFMDIFKADDPETELKLVFKNKVIPLLEEYFYGQIQNIGLILGGDFITTKYSENSVSEIFPKNFTAHDPPVERVIYSIKDPTEFSDLTPFLNIYE